MNKKEETSNAEQNKTIDTLKENYIRRIDEVDSFSKRFATVCTEINTELLYGWLNIAQHCLDIQKKYSRQYSGGWKYPSDMATKIIKQNTNAWIQTVHNIDSICIDSMKNMKSNLAGINKGSTQCIQNMERFYEIYKNNSDNYNSNDEDVSKNTLASKTISEISKSQDKQSDSKK